MRIGYVRGNEEGVAKQEELLIQNNVDMIINDLETIMKRVNSGDEVMVVSADRISRDVEVIEAVVQKFDDKSVDVIAVGDNAELNFNQSEEEYLEKIFAVKNKDVINN